MNWPRGPRLERLRPGIGVGSGRRGVSMVFQSYAIWPHSFAPEHALPL